MAVTLTVTNAGRTALVNGANTGTAPVTIAAVGVSPNAVTASPALTNLPGEIKRIGTLSGDVVADDTIHLIVRDESNAVFTMRSFALYLGDGTLFAIYGQPDAILEKSSQALMLLAIDVQFADVAATQLTFGNSNFLNPPATETVQGVAEIATQAETDTGSDDARIVTPKKLAARITSWLSGWGADIWRASNDGAGSGLDADLLDGQQGSYYANVPARLGYTPIQQGTGNGQLANTVKIGWSAATRLKATVDATDLGHFVFDANISDVWRASNDGAGSGLDADLLDGQQGSYYVNIPARLGYVPAKVAGDTFTGAVGFGDADNFLSLNAQGNPLWGWAPGYGFSFDRASNTAAIVADNQTRVTFSYSGMAVAGNLAVGGTMRRAGHLVWDGGNDGAGSGLDADLLDGQQGNYYSDISGRLGFTPVQQGTGVGQTPNVVKVGWSGAGRLKATVDNVDLGNVVFDANIADVWRASNDGAGSGLDADLLDGLDGNAYAKRAGTDFTGSVSIGDINNVHTLNAQGNPLWIWAPGHAFTFDRSNNTAAIVSANQARVTFSFEGVSIAGTLNVGGTIRRAGNQVWDGGNDGSGSGLDADLLDGLQATDFMRVVGQNMNPVDGYRIFADGTKECWSQFNIGQHQQYTWTLPVGHAEWVHPSFALTTANGIADVQDNTGIVSINGAPPTSITFWNADNRTITIWVRTIGR